MIQLDAIFNYIPKTVREELADDDQIRSWALQVLKMINIPDARYEKAIHFDTIENHKVKLPEDLKKIYKVSFASQPPTDKEFNEFCRCGEENGVQVDKDCTTIYHHLFLNSTYYQSQYSPVAYKGIRLNSDYVCKVNWSGCYGFYSTDGNYLTMSEPHGYVAVEYFAELKESGNYLIPDIEELKLAMSHWVEAQYYRDRLSRAEANMGSMYQSNLMQAKNYFLNARAILLARGINVPLHRELIYGESRIKKIHTKIRPND